MSMIGDGAKLTLGFEMCRPRHEQSRDEGEMVASKELISDVTDTYRNFIDVVVYDSLACNSPWINRCLGLGLDVVVRVKKNKNNSLKEVKVKTNKHDPIEIWTDDEGA